MIGKTAKDYKFAITNEMLDNGIEKSELVHILQDLPSPSPLILYSGSYFAPFLKALFMNCREVFNMPYVAMDEISAHVFGYIVYKRLYDILPDLQSRAHERSTIPHDYLKSLYYVSLAVFEGLQERYQMRSLGELKNLYSEYLVED